MGAAVEEEEVSSGRPRGEGREGERVEEGSAAGGGGGSGLDLQSLGGTGGGDVVDGGGGGKDIRDESRRVGW